jgi:hypothetical protein
MGRSRIATEMLLQSGVNAVHTPAYPSQKAGRDEGATGDVVSMSKRRKRRAGIDVFTTEPMPADNRLRPVQGAVAVRGATLTQNG